MSNINHPKHYNTGKFEVIEVIKDWNLNFNLGNSIKYIGRAEHKGKKIEDLCKAKWYIERELQDLGCKVSDEKLKQEIDDKESEFRPTVQDPHMNYISLVKYLNNEIAEWKISNTLDNEIEELCDIIQCCYNLLDYITKGKLEEKIKFHNQKLKNRGWKFKR